MYSSKLIGDAQGFMGESADMSRGSWLIHDYRGSNPIFWQIVGDNIGMVTRPCFLYVPAAGSPRLLVHHVDAGKFTESGLRVDVYRDRKSMVGALRGLLPLGEPVAMEYSPLCELPRVSKVDAGTVEMVNSLGAKIVSSGDLLQHVTQRWNAAQLVSHKRAAEKLGRMVQDAFSFVEQRQRAGITEFQVAEFIRKQFGQQELVSPDGPVVAVNAHTSDPHYEPAPSGSSPIGPGDWLLIDLWAREQSEDGMYADITWVAYVGEHVPEKHLEVFQVAAIARDTAVKYLAESFKDGVTLQGYQVDRQARDYIARRGYGDYFTHRLGHSIGREVHSDGVNLDDFETHDTRSIVPGICFSVEPGIYLPEFGVRTEINVYISEQGPLVTTPVQQGVALIQS